LARFATEPAPSATELSACACEPLPSAVELAPAAVEPAPPAAELAPLADGSARLLVLLARKLPATLVMFWIFWSVYFFDSSMA
jgi:hypothetical protein